MREETNLLVQLHVAVKPVLLSVPHGVPHHAEHLEVEDLSCTRRNGERRRRKGCWFLEVSGGGEGMVLKTYWSIFLTTQARHDSLQVLVPA